MNNSKDFSIDKSKCIKCKECIDVCSVRILEWSEGKQEVFFIKDAEDYCNKCGHCIAICKSKAVFLPEGNNDGLMDASNNWNNCGDIVKKLIKNRRSIRKYKATKISDHEIGKLIDIARYAPSASNAHQVDWLIYSDAEKIKEISRLTIEWMKNKLKAGDGSVSDRYVKVFSRFIREWNDGNDPICRNAPHFIIVHGPETGTIRHIDGIIALDYFEFAAISSGFGTCWIGLFYHVIEELYQPMLEYISLPDGHVCYGAMILGYPEYKYAYLPERKEANIEYR
ncbi:MAG TPA: nitroreductase family protein [Victivallales bacterium]|nr:nitroreductase family protein [Victivallales bacterium]